MCGIVGLFDTRGRRSVDRELLVEGELFDEFGVLWLLLHASRCRHPQTARGIFLRKFLKMAFFADNRSPLRMS